MTRPIHRGHRGFTLIELLTVIGIITVLVAILLPVASKVRQAARVSSTKQAMQTLSGAIDQYYQEYNDYPGVMSNTDITSGVLTVKSVPITSTENMVLALCGGLLPGTPPTYNAPDILSGAGPISLGTNIYTQTRHPAFIGATPGTNMPNTGSSPPWDPSDGITGTSDSVVPEFTDRFTGYNNGPRSIIYIRARRGNPLSDANAPSGHIIFSDDSKTQYNYMHLFPYIMPARGDFFNFPGSSSIDPTSTNPDASPNLTLNQLQYPTLWDQYFQGTQVPLAPRGANKYILISAGPDGIFGNTDDILFP